MENFACSTDLFILNGVKQNKVKVVYSLVNLRNNSYKNLIFNDKKRSLMKAP